MRHSTLFSPRTRSARRGRAIPRRALAGLAVGAVTAAVAVPLRSSTTRRDDALTAAVAITSVPSGADVLVDGTGHGRTPTCVAVSPGAHQVELRHSAAIDWAQTVQSVAGQEQRLAVTLWRRLPVVEPLRPPFPGATIADAKFLATGHVALQIALPPGSDHQLWRRGGDGRLTPLGPASAPGPLAAAPDGHAVAYVTGATAPSTTSGSRDTRPLRALWTARADGQGAAPRYTLPANDAASELVDLSWAPDGAHLLLAATRQLANGGVRTQLLKLDPRHGSVDTLVELPSAIVPGSAQWSPRGDQVALLTRAGDLTSLCLLGVTPPGFRYLADLQRGGAGLPSFVPLAWTPDGAGALYAAPIPAATQTLGGLLFGSHPASGLFLVTSSAVQGRRLGQAACAWPVWQPNGQILAVVRPSGQAGFALATVDATSGAAQPQGPLPLPASLAGLRWDPVGARAIAATTGDGGGLDYQLLTFAPEVR